MAADRKRSTARRAAEIVGGSHGRHAGLGLQFAAAMGFGGVVGHLADRKLGTAPWLLVAGVFLGAAGGFVYLIRTVFPTNRGRPQGGGPS